MGKCQMEQMDDAERAQKIKAFVNAYAWQLDAQRLYASARATTNIGYQRRAAHASHMARRALRALVHGPSWLECQS